jgi:hypothetical protein
MKNIQQKCLKKIESIKFSSTVQEYDLYTHK